MDEEPNVILCDERPDREEDRRHLYEVQITCRNSQGGTDMGRGVGMRMGHPCVKSIIAHKCTLTCVYIDSL